MEKLVFVIVSPQQFSHPLSGNAKDMAHEIAKQHKVYYVNLPLDIKTIFFKKHKAPEDQLRIDILKRKQAGIIVEKPNLIIAYPKLVLLSINQIPNRFLYQLLNHYNNFIFARAIKKIVKREKEHKLILLNDNLMSKGLYLQDYLKPAHSFYYLRDNFENHSYYGHHGIKDQFELFSKVDAVFTNSAFLAEKAAPYSKLAKNIGQGLRIPKKDARIRLNLEEYIKKPVIGYIGNITTMRLDLPLLEKIAAEMPGYTFLFVGPIDRDFQKSELQVLPNVIFVGQQPSQNIPHFMDYIDVAINPQVINEMTLGNYPRKIDEYLHYGKPVVAVKTDFMVYFKDYVYLAENQTHFVILLQQAIAENNMEKQQQRISYAAQHTWQNCVNHIYKHIAEAQ